MTSKEKYDVVKEVCDEIRAGLQRESDRLKEVAEGYENTRHRLHFLDKAFTLVESQIVVTSVENKLQWPLIHKIIDEELGK